MSWFFRLAWGRKVKPYCTHISVRGRERRGWPIVLFYGQILKTLLDWAGRWALDRATSCSPAYYQEESKWDAHTCQVWHTSFVGHKTGNWRRSEHKGPLKHTPWKKVEGRKSTYPWKVRHGVVMWSMLHGTTYRAKSLTFTEEVSKREDFVTGDGKYDQLVKRKVLHMTCMIWQGIILHDVARSFSAVFVVHSGSSAERDSFQSDMPACEEGTSDFEKGINQGYNRSAQKNVLQKNGTSSGLGAFLQLLHRKPGEL